MTLGEKIQQLRRAAALSQEQLAEHLDVSRQSVSKWELNDAVPDIGKIVLLCELFGISADELLRDKADADKSSSENSTSMLERVTRMNAANHRLALGFKTIVAGLAMLVLEFMLLPVFGTLQKAHVDGQGFYSEFIQYAKMQPMPIVFALTAALIAVGAAFLALGLLEQKQNRRN